VPSKSIEIEISNGVISEDRREFSELKKEKLPRRLLSPFLRHEKTIREILFAIKTQKFFPET